DHAIGLQLVARDQLLQQLLGCVEDRVDVVALRRDRAADGVQALAHGAASFQSRLTSGGRSRLALPSGRVPSASGPKRIRASATTWFPTASTIRRTCRLRPSAIVSSRTLAEDLRTLAGLVGPSSRSTPPRRRRSCDSVAGRRSRTR